MKTFLVTAIFTFFALSGFAQTEIVKNTFFKAGFMQVDEAANLGLVFKGGEAGNRVELISIKNHVLNLLNI